MKNRILFFAAIAALLMTQGCNKSGGSSGDDAFQALLGTWTYEDIRSGSWGDEKIVDPVKGSFTIKKIDNTHVKFTGDINTEALVTTSGQSGTDYAALDLVPVIDKAGDKDLKTEYATATVFNGTMIIVYSTSGEWPKDGHRAHYLVTGKITAKKK